MTNNNFVKTIKLNSEQWEKFLQLMESPQPVNERLKRLLTEPSVFEMGSTGEFIVNTVTPIPFRSFGSRCY
jgi:hypothetical protein